MAPRLGTSLRTRLILAFMALVSLILLIGLAALSINERMRDDVVELRAGIGSDLSQLPLASLGLEIKGLWDPSGTFIAREVEVHPGARRPKLRGTIQAVDDEAGTFTVYGRAIHVDEASDFQLPGGPFAATTSKPAAGRRAKDADDDDGDPADLRGRDGMEHLVAGARTEVTCDVDPSGRWWAREVRLRDVKASDKIKGTATAWDLDGEIPESLEIHGLHVTLSIKADATPDSALQRIETATQLTLALHECRGVAHELLGRAVPEAGADATSELDRDVELPTSVRDRLLQTARDFSYYLSRASSAGSVDDESLESSARWLDRLNAEVPTLDRHVARLLELAPRPAQARRYVDEVLDPYLMSGLQPLVHAYMKHSEEELDDQLEALVARSDDTAEFALVTSGVAVFAALVLAFLLWRSIHRPVTALHAAARQMAEGRLDTRVDVETEDEFGDLADAMNLMASELARTTVSMGDLDNVFDSMAGALVILDREGRIVRTNRATQELVGRPAAELLRLPFEAICRGADGAGWRDALAGDATAGSRAASNGHAASASAVELSFVRPDGSAVPVALAGAPLRADAAGQSEGFVCVAQDLSERKAIEEHIRKSLDEKELLLREVHHRVKNNMQVISSLLELQAAKAGDTADIGAFAESQSRVRSMALIHEQLYQSNDLANIDVRTYIEVLTAQLAHSFGRQSDVQIELEVEDLELDIDQSLACGLIINELVVNAYKHAFPGDQGGSIRVSLVRCTENGDACLTVSDDGRGLVESLKDSSRKGLGSSLIRMLVKQLRGEMDVDGAEGAAVRIRFPLHAPAGAVS